MAIVDRAKDKTFGKIIILGVFIDDLSEKQVLAKVDQFLNNNEADLIFTPNPEICLKAEKDVDYRKLLNKSDLNIPDGVGLKLGAQILGQELNNRLTGVDLTKKVLEKCNEKSSCKVFVINRKKPLSPFELVKKTFEKLYPNIQVEGLEVGQNELNKIIVQLNKFKPDIVLCANGAPIQERLLFKIRENTNVFKLGIGVGGSLDFITGKAKRAPKWWRDMGMEWFYRLLKQPSRYKRIKDATIKFPLMCYKWQMRIKAEYRPNVVAIITKDDKFLIQNNKRFPYDHWQFAQGGIDKKEALKKAVVREASEELGVDQKLFKVIKQLPIDHSYDWPKWGQLIKGYKGQQQKFFLLKYLGGDSDFNFEKSDEVQAIKWVAKQDLKKYIHHKRHESLEKVLRCL